MAEQANQAIGKVMIVYGTVKAESADGVVRVLQPNSPIFFNDRINTGADGAVSIVFSDPANTQLDLGRMTDMVITEDVLASGEGGAASLDDVAAEVDGDVARVCQQEMRRKGAHEQDNDDDDAEFHCAFS